MKSSSSATAVATPSSTLTIPKGVETLINLYNYGNFLILINRRHENPQEVFETHFYDKFSGIIGPHKNSPWSAIVLRTIFEIVCDYTIKVFKNPASLYFENKVPILYNLLRIKVENPTTITERFRATLADELIALKYQKVKDSASCQSDVALKIREDIRNSFSDFNSLVINFLRRRKTDLHNMPISYLKTLSVEERISLSSERKRLSHILSTVKSITRKEVRKQIAEARKRKFEVAENSTETTETPFKRAAEESLSGLDVLALAACDAPFSEIRAHKFTSLVSCGEFFGSAFATPITPTTWEATINRNLCSASTFRITPCPHSIAPATDSYDPKAAAGGGINGGSTSEYYTTHHGTTEPVKATFKPSTELAGFCKIRTISTKTGFSLH